MHPLDTAAQARRQVASARAAVTRTAKQVGHGWTDAVNVQLEARHERALQRLDAAEARLDAILSQQPDRQPFQRLVSS